MKKMLLLGALVFASSVFADVKLPKGSFDYTEYNKAVEQAKAENKPIVLLFTDVKTICPKAAGCTVSFIEAAGRRNVLVYLDINKSTDYFNKFNKETQEALRKGKYYPKIVLLDPEDKKVVLATNYDEHVKDPKKNTKIIQKSLRDFASSKRVKK